jgi:membrane-associated phospholipid phosphatase
LTLYLYYFLSPLSRPSSGWALVVTIAPSLFAAWVGASRVIDYYHNASDVLAGAFIGISIALLMFYIHFDGEWGAPGGGEAGGLAAVLQRRPHSASVDIGSIQRYRSTPHLAARELLPV